MSNAPRDGRARKFWGDDDSQTPILHVDMDSFFAQVEIAENPDLRGRPIIVGHLGGRGVVTSATYEVRARGVRAGMPSARAHALCPEATFVFSGRGVYSEYSHKVMAILSEITPVLQQVSIDEAFLDVSGSRRRLGSPTEIGNLIRTRIHAEVGLPASVGIAATKSVAKIASSNAKPDGLLLIPRDQTVPFLHGLPVGALWGVGGKMGERLTLAGVDTIGDLANLDMTFLTRLVGRASARHLHNLAWGIDPRPVRGDREVKSMSTERTFESDIHDRSELEAFLLQASHECAARLRRADMVAWGIGLKLRDASFHTIVRSAKLHAPTDVGRQIYTAASELFAKEAMPASGIRLAGVKVEALQPRSAGVAIALDDDGKPLASERAMDQIQGKFGRDALRPATLLPQVSVHESQSAPPTH